MSNFKAQMSNQTQNQNDQILTLSHLNIGLKFGICHLDF